MFESGNSQAATRLERARVLDKIRAIIFGRQRAYRDTFLPESVPAQAVLKDLARFCRANKTTFNADPRKHAIAEGRREVWLRIQKNLKLSSDDLWKLYESGE